ncbi:hypothetical protein GCM10022222_82200 [Amycolatopsis ultiminotia]|uniref:Uncharacterized protein n=1 Tax=Amycolatopsis ultiminotia TaxID=543629 RepID=A0ABP6YMG9_9PSEU
MHCWPRVLAAGRGPHRTADGWISVLPYTRRDWENFFADVDTAAVSPGPRFAAPAAETAGPDELMASLSAVLATKSTQHWIGYCGRHGIAAERLFRLDAATTDPYVRERHLLVDANIRRKAPTATSARPLASRQPVPVSGGTRPEPGRTPARCSRNWVWTGR